MFDFSSLVFNDIYSLSLLNSFFIINDKRQQQNQNSLL